MCFPDGQILSLLQSSGGQLPIVDLFPPNIFHPAVATFYVDTLYHSRAAYVKMWIIMKMEMKNTAPCPLVVSPKTAYSKGRGS